MRLTKKFLLNISLIGITLLALLSCKKDDAEPTLSGAEQTKLLLVGGTWSVQSVQVDGTDQSGSFSGLTLGFTDSGFTTTNGGVIWPASGTWVFSDDTGKTMDRDDGLSLTIDDISTTSLQLTLVWDKTTLGSGRVKSVKGTHVFLFGK